MTRENLQCTDACFAAVVVAPGAGAPKYCRYWYGADCDGSFGAVAVARGARAPGAVLIGGASRRDDDAVVGTAPYVRRVVLAS